MGKRLENVTTDGLIDEKKESKTEKLLESLMSEINQLKLNQNKNNGQKYSHFYQNRNRIQPLNRNQFPRNAEGQVRCYDCGKIGHVARFCQLNAGGNDRANNRMPQNFNPQRNRRIPQMPDRSNNGNNEANLVAEDRIMVKILIKDKEFRAIVDTGAEHSFITTNCFFELGCELKPWLGGGIRGINGSSKTPIGTIEVNADLIQEKRKTNICLKARVLEYLPYDIIIGMSTMKEAKALIDPCTNKIFFRSAIPQLSVNEAVSIENNKLVISAKQGILIPPKSAVQVPIIIKQRPRMNDEITINPGEKLCKSTRLNLASNQIKLNNSEGEITVCNSEDFSFFIKTNENIGKVKKILKTKESVLISIDQKEMKQIEEHQNSAINSELQSLCLSKGSVAVGASLNNNEKEKLSEVLEEHIDSFAFDASKQGKTSLCQHQIDTGNNRPFSLPPYNISLAERLAVKDEITRMRKLGVIVESTSPYSSTIIIVGKKDGGVRICGDFRRLNKNTIPDNYPLPSVQDALDCVSGSSFFSLIDLKSGYWQVEIDPKDREKTAIIPRDGLYEFIVMPFGLRNAPATFQRLMDAVLADMKWIFCIPYLDDILIFSRTFSEHLHHLKAVLNRLKIANLVIQPPKVAFVVNAINYLGHVISAEGIKPQADKIKAVINLAPLII